MKYEEESAYPKEGADYPKKEEMSSDSYKEMYEMGERLISMAKAGGYDPDSSDVDMEKGSGDYPMDKKGGSAAQAMKFFEG